MSAHAPIDDYLEILLAHDGTDLHLAPNDAPRGRVHGTLHPLPVDHSLTSDAVRALLEPFLPEGLAREWNERERSTVDFALSRPPGRFRVSLFEELNGIAAVIRRIPDAVPSSEELGLPDVVLRLAEQPNGLVLFTGPAGSGKSTSLACIVDRINRTRAGHILTIEDPIEHTYRPVRCRVTQREVPSHVSSYLAGLMEALRHDPDVIVLGELRDTATIQAALTTAETGHLVLATMHTVNATSALSRIVDAVETNRQKQVATQVAHVLRAVVAQRLVPLRSRTGRVGAFEVLVNIGPSITTPLVEGRLQQVASVMDQTDNEMQTLESALAHLVNEGLVTAEDAEPFANDRAEFRRRLTHRLRSFRA